VHWSADGGATWTAATGVPAGARVAADRVEPQRFYAVAGGTFYRSDDGGATFTATATGLPAEGNVRFAAVPGYAGHVWLAGGSTGNTYGMWRSTNAGRTFKRIAAVDEGDAVGFGKPAPGRAYPAIYTSSKINGVRGIFRSDDAGRHWQRINDDAHQWAWTGADITGDPRVHGRVYVATNGRGIVVGDIEGVPTAECAVRYRTLAQWSDGFLASVSVTNTGRHPIAGWTVEWSLGGDAEIARVWGATAAAIGADVAATNLTWNATIRPHRTVTVGFVGTAAGDVPAPTGFTLNGSVCSLR
jgi:hypothetical protein